MNKIRVGVIGTGHLGKLHASLYREVEQAQLCGVFDLNRDKANNIASELGVEVFDTVDKLLAVVDAVNIVTPTTTHFELAQQALAKGLHVFVEKPVTSTEDEAETLIRLAGEQQRTLQIGHIERFNPAVLEALSGSGTGCFIKTHRSFQRGAFQ